MKDLVYEFRSSLRQLDRVVNFQSKSCLDEITTAQCHVLLQIESEHRTTSNELSRLLNLDISTISRTVENLLKAKLIVKKQNVNDKRSFVLRLSKKGSKLCDEINAFADEYFSRVIENIPAKDRTQILKHFSTLVKAFVVTELNPDNLAASCGLRERQSVKK